MSERTGNIDFCVGSETYQTWYKVVGNLHSGVRPAVVLHGGPGLTHHYVLPFTALHAHFRIPVVFYDQIGSGASSHPKDVPNAFWTLDVFMDQLDGVLDHLGIRDDFDLIGHSFGATLAVNYVCHRHPPGLRHLVLAGAAPSTSLWLESTRQLLAKLPQELRETLEKHEREGTMDHLEYGETKSGFYARHVCKLVPWPKGFIASLTAAHADPTVYTAMIGVSEFNVVGTMKDWSCLDQIHTIDCPTLLTSGADDLTQEVCLRPFVTKIPNVRWETFAKSSHLAFFEEPDRYFDVVKAFLTEAEA